jgi:hypothetical protein
MLKMALSCLQWPPGQPQAGSAADAGDGAGSPGSKAEDQPPGAAASDPYLLRGLAIDRPNRVRALTLATSDDPWVSLSGCGDGLAQPVCADLASVEHNDSSFCVDVLEDTLRKETKKPPGIDQYGRRGRWLDHVFVQRLWRHRGLDPLLLGLPDPPAACGPSGMTPVVLLLRLDDAAASPTTPQRQQPQNMMPI